MTCQKQITTLTAGFGLFWFRGQATCNLLLWRWEWVFKWRGEGECTRFFRRYQEGRQAEKRETRAKILGLKKMN